MATYGEVLSELLSGRPVSWADWVHLTDQQALDVVRAVESTGEFLYRDGMFIRLATPEEVSGVDQ